MNKTKKILLFFILPILGTLSYDPALLIGAPAVLGIVLLFLIVLGLFLWRGSSNALTFMIFLQGMNTIIRIMMLISNSINKENVFGLQYTIFGLIGLAVSFYLMLRLDKVDVRQTISH